MKTIVFNFYGSLIDQAYESISLRTGYMLGDHTVSVGTSGMDICFEENFNPHSIEQKVEIMNGFWGPKGEKTFDIEDLKRTQKAMRKMKYKDKEGIVLQKKLEKATDNLFAFCKQEMLEERQKKGLPQLLPLCDGPTLGFYSIHPKKQEDDSQEGYFKLSEIMSMQFPEEDKNEGRGLFIVPPSFMLKHDELKKKIFKAGDAEANERDNMYLEFCFRFPNINVLNAVELKAVREYLEPVTIPFRKAVDEWMRMCEEESVSGKSVDYFRKEVRLRAGEVAVKIKENKVLQDSDRMLNFRAITNIWMGEAPWINVWKFYRGANAITDEAWEALMKVKEEKNMGHLRCVVMALEMPGLKEHMAAQKQKAEITDVAPVKKSLSMN